MIANWINQKGFFSWIINLILLAILTISAIAIYLNLPNSLPGDLIYPIKEISENLHLSYFELDTLGTARFYTELSNKRMDEIKKLISRREKDDKITQTLERLELMQKRAVDSMVRARNRGGTDISKQLSILEMSLQRQQDYLRKSLFELSPKIDDAIGKAIDSTADSLERVNTIKKEGFKV